MNTAFGILGRFFELVVEGMLSLRDSLTIELVAGDFITDIPKLVFDPQALTELRPTEAPFEYDRVWLGNTPYAKDFHRKFHSNDLFLGIILKV